MAVKPDVATISSPADDPPGPPTPPDPPPAGNWRWFALGFPGLMTECISSALRARCPFHFISSLNYRSF